MTRRSHDDIEAEAAPTQGDPADPSLARQAEPRARSTPSIGTLGRAISWTAVGHVLGQSFWLGSLLVLARLLTPDAFGVMTVGLILVTVSTRLVGSATGGGMIIAEHLSRPQVTTALKFNIASCLALSAVIALLSVPMANAFSDGNNALVIGILGLAVALYGPSIVPLALLSRGLLFKRRAAVQAGAAITASTIAVVAALLGAGVWSLVIRQLLIRRC